MTGTDLAALLNRLLGAEPGAADGTLLGSLLEALGSGGGQSLAGLVQQLEEGGLGAQARSWVGTGGGEAVTGPQIAQALPYQTLDHAAARAGLTPEEAADRIARLLPRTIDLLTPDGAVPPGSLEDAVRSRL